jgi:uncharacterized Zn finger protein
MTRESADAKGRRYLTEGRLHVRRVTGDAVEATCRGGDRYYRLGHDPARGWWCDCAARTGRCAHLTALQLVCSRQPARLAPATTDRRSA